MKLLVVLSVCVGITVAQDCMAEMRKAKQCAAGDDAPSDEERREMRQALKDAKEAAGSAISQCFQDNECEDPIPIVKSLKECMKKEMKAKVAPKIVGCMSRQGVDIPDEIRQKLAGGDDDDDSDEEGPEGPPGPPGGFGGLFGGMGGQGKGKGKGRGGIARKMGEKLEKLAGEVCPNEKSAKKAIKCSKKAVRETMKELKGKGKGKGKGNGRGKGRGANGRLALLRSFRSNGCAPPPMECIQKMMAAKAALCTCAEELDTEENRSAVAVTVQSCKAEAGVEGSLSDDDRDAIKDKIAGIKEKVCSAGPPMMGGGNF